MRWQRWQDWATVILGVGLMTMPVITQTTSTAAICTAYGMGALIALAGIASASMKEATPFSWVAAILGVVLVAMPWIFQFTGETAMAWASWIVGAGTVLVSGYEAAFTARAVPA